MLSRRIPIQIPLGLTAVLLAAVVSYSIAFANENSKFEDISDKVECNVPRSLRVFGRNTYYVSVKLKNVSSEPIIGPVAIVVRDTGIAELNLRDPSGKTIDGHAYVVVLEDGQTLDSRRSTVAKKLHFESAGRLSSRERRNLALDYQIVRLLRPSKKSQNNDPGQQESADTPKKTATDKKPAGTQTSMKKFGINQPPAAVMPNKPNSKGDTLPPNLIRVMTIQDKWTERLMARDGVIGTATGLDAKKRPVIKVYAVRGDIRGLPEMLDGVRVEVVVTGSMIAMHDRGHGGSRSGRGGSQSGRGGDGESGGRSSDGARDRFERPSPIGVSASSLRGCTTGTIGCRVRDAEGAVYILSNNHVLARTNLGQAGDRIVQPGLVDSGCLVSDNDVVATLTNFVTIDHDSLVNRVDAAIARVREDMLGTSTPSDGYGSPQSISIQARIGMRVQKYGRTTGLTKGVVTAINATINVMYREGEPTRFVDQIIVNSRSDFILSGDSGALLVSDPDRQPVGLLFAGSSGGERGIANPIDFVLKSLGVTMDVDDSAPPNGGKRDGDRRGDRDGDDGGDRRGDRGGEGGGDRDDDRGAEKRRGDRGGEGGEGGDDAATNPNSPPKTDSNRKPTKPGKPPLGKRAKSVLGR